MSQSKVIRILALALTLAGANIAVVSRAAPVEVTRNPGESDTDFVQRITKQTVVPDAAEHRQIASTSALIKGAETLIAFTEATDESDRDPEPAYDIALNVFLKMPDGSYSWVGKSTACEIEGGSPSMRTFFYANPDNTPDLEIGVICGWDESHAGADCAANDEVRFFKADRNAVTEVPMKQYETLFYKQEKPDKGSDFTCTVSKFRTAADVKNLLKAHR